MGFYDDDFIDKVMAATDIVEIIGSKVVIQEKGRSFIGRCPFHNEKTPSFHVSKEKQVYHCFGCGASGNALSFLRSYENMPFTDAIEYLAGLANIPVPEKTKAPDMQAEMKDRLFAINEVAMRYYYNYLNTEEGKKALYYLIQRKITPEIKREFLFGYAPYDQGELLESLQSLAFTLQEILDSGIFLRKDGGELVARFRNRLMFPIQDYKARVIGFGARALTERGPKYLNSSESIIFQKKANLYNWHRAIGEARRTGRIFLMEGYMDVISVYQSGQKNVVASLGTSFTEEQAQFMTKYCKEALLVFDGDKAGIDATMRAIQILEQQQLSLKIVELPDAKDPDEYIKKNGFKAWEMQVAKAISAFEFKLKRACGRHDKSSVEGKLKIVEEILPELNKIRNEIEKHEYIKYLANELQIDESAVLFELQKNGQKTPKKVAIMTATGVKEQEVKNSQTEILLLKTVLEFPQRSKEAVQELAEEYFQDKTCFELMKKIAQYYANQQTNILGEDFLQMLTSEENYLFGEVDSLQLPPRNELMLKELVKKLQHDYWRNIYKKLQNQQMEAQLNHNEKLLQEIGEKIVSIQLKLHKLQ
ncbi:MAG: DNA primase [Clostridia bacterium]